MKVRIVSNFNPEKLQSQEEIALFLDEGMPCYGISDSEDKYPVHSLYTGSENGLNLTSDCHYLTELCKSRSEGAAERGRIFNPQTSQKGDILKQAIIRLMDLVNQRHNLSIVENNEPEFTNPLLQAIVHSDQSLAKEWIKKSPELLFKGQDITDLSDREFKNIKPLDMPGGVLMSRIFQHLLIVFQMKKKPR